MGESHPDPPLASVTYQPTLDDLVAVSVLTAYQPRALGVRFLLNALTIAAITGIVGLFWWRDGHHGPALAVWLYAVVHGVSVLLRFLRFKQRLSQTLATQFAKRKNIGFAVPTTVALFEQYIDISSTLELDRMHWDVVEQIEWRESYLLLTVGAKTIYLPRRAFADESEASAFAAHAIRCCEQSHARMIDLRQPPPWDTPASDGVRDAGKAEATPEDHSGIRY